MLQITKDVDVNNNAYSTSCTVTFSTSAGNELLLAFCATQNGAGFQSVSGSSLAWKKLMDDGVAGHGTVAIYYAWADSPVTSETFTATLQFGNKIFVNVKSFKNADRLQAVGVTTGTSTTPSVNLTTNRNASFVLGVGYAQADDSITAGTNQTITASWFDNGVGNTGTASEMWTSEQNATTPTNGTTVTTNATLGGSDAWNIISCEIEAMYQPYDTSGDDYFNPDAATYLGFEYLINGSSTSNIADGTTYMAGLIVPTKSGNVTSLNFANWDITGTAQQATVELRHDGGGEPADAIMVSGTVTPTGQFLWNQAIVSSTPVLAGVRYWITVHFPTNSSTNSIRLRRVLGQDRIIIPVLAAFRSSSGGTGRWSLNGDTDALSCGLGFDDGTYQGMAYGDFDVVNPTAYGGTQAWGEFIHMPADTVISSLGMWVAKNGAGTPSDDLHYEIYNVSNSVSVQTGVLVAAASVTTTLAWYDVSLGTNITLLAGKNYRIHMYTNATSGTLYSLNKPKTTGGFENAMTYGGITNKSTNGQTEFAANDVPFRLTLVQASLGMPLLSLLGVG